MTCTADKVNMRDIISEDCDEFKKNKKYKKTALKLHPDKNPGCKDLAEEKFKELQEKNRSCEEGVPMPVPKRERKNDNEDFRRQEEIRKREFERKQEEMRKREFERKQEEMRRRDFERKQRERDMRNAPPVWGLGEERFQRYPRNYPQPENPYNYYNQYQNLNRNRNQNFQAPHQHYQRQQERGRSRSPMGDRERSPMGDRERERSQSPIRREMRDFSPERGQGWKDYFFEKAGDLANRFSEYRKKQNVNSGNDVFRGKYYQWGDDGERYYTEDHGDYQARELASREGRRWYKFF